MAAKLTALESKEIYLVDTEDKVLPLVHVIGTGGSISGVGRSRLDYVNYADDGKHLTVEEMLARIPEVREFADVRAEQLSNDFGGNLNPAIWLKLAARINAVLHDGAVGAVVTHGTATLEETAYFLNLTVKNDKPVVITGAMRPPSAISTDADINIIDAVRVAVAPQSRGNGALVVVNNEIHAARDVTKSHTSRVHTFRSPEFGCLGYADPDKSVIFYRRPVKAHTSAAEFNLDGVTDLPRVDIIMGYAGADGLLIDLLAESGKCQGIVSAGTGSGTVPTAFREALQRAQARGIAIVIASHAGSGRARNTERNRRQGFIGAGDLSPKKARILLMLALTKTKDPAAIQEMMLRY